MSALFWAPFAAVVCLFILEFARRPFWGPNRKALVDIVHGGNAKALWAAVLNRHGSMGRLILQVLGIWALAQDSRDSSHELDARLSFTRAMQEYDRVAKSLAGDEEVDWNGFDELLLNWPENAVQHEHDGGRAANVLVVEASKGFFTSILSNLLRKLSTFPTRLFSQSAPSHRYEPILLPDFEEDETGDAGNPAESRGRMLAEAEAEGHFRGLREYQDYGYGMDAEDAGGREREREREALRHKYQRAIRQGRALGENTAKFMVNRVVPAVVWPLKQLFMVADHVSDEVLALRERQGRVRLQ